ncbi:MAG: RNA polymerase sigma factor [Gammaproteobacteria bacterium]
MHNSVAAVNLGSSMNDDLKDQTDESLMLRYSTGDAAAFEVLYSRHKGPLFRYFRRQCSEAAIAEELFQDSWMSIIKARKKYISSAKFTTYMYTVAHNKLIDYYRRNKIRFSDSVSNDDCETEDIIEALPASKQQQPEHILAAEQKRTRLLSAIELLPEKQREVFLLREESGLSLDEIARITNVNAETAKSRLRYAVNSLTKTIQAGDS